MGLQCVKVGLNRRQGGAQIACRWGWGDDFCNLAMMDITKKWTGRRQDWSMIHAQMAIYFAGRMPE